jgi:hypothetical protein
MEFSKDNCFIESAPDESDMGATWDIIRADPKHPRTFVSVSPEVFGIRTHYWSGRTQPCLRSGCPACKSDQLPRWHGYLAAIAAPDRRRVLVEFPAQAAAAFQAAHSTYGSLRLLRFVLDRTKNKANAKVRIAVNGLVPAGPEWPDAPDIWEVLCRIWQLKARVSAKFEEFSQYAFNGSDRAEYLRENPSAVHDTEWMQSNGHDLPGQSRMF